MPKFFDVQIEKKVLTGMLQDMDALEYGISKLSVNDFEEVNISYLFDIVSRFYAKYYKCITREILTNWLDKNDPKSKTTLLLLFTEIIALPFDTYYKYYINELKTYTLRRKLYTIHDRITKGLNTDEDPDTLFSDLSRKILVSNVSSTVHRTSVHDSIDDRIKLYKDKRDFPEKYQGVQYGMREVDELTGGMFSGQLYMVAGRSGAGKCVAEGTKILMPNGSLHNIEDVVRDENSANKILTLTHTKQLIAATPTHFMSSGNQYVYQLNTTSGREIKLTAEHPLMTIDGWAKLNTLKIGDQIAVPRRLDVFGTNTLSKDTIKTLALMHTNCEVPLEVFTLPEKDLALFLSYIYVDTRAFPIVFKTKFKSIKLLEQLAHLLLRFGILTLKEKRTLTVLKSYEHLFLEKIGKYFTNKKRVKLQKNLSKRQKGTQDIIDRIPMQLVFSHLPRNKAGKIDLRDTNMEYGEDWNEYGIPRNVLNKLAIILNKKELYQLANANIFWDTIKSIEFIGSVSTYDLEMEPTRNFIANDIYVHNSRWLFNIGCNVAKRHQTVMYCTIEMEAAIIQNMWESRETRIPLKKIMRAELSPEEEKRYLDFIQLSAQAKIPFYIVDIPQGCTTGMIDAEVATFEKIHGKVPDIVLIDYANLINPISRFKDRAEKYDHVFRELKEGARAHRTPFYTAAQLNRDSLKSKEPGTEHVAFSDAASYHCDAVFRVFADKNNDVENDIQLEVMKGRYHEKKCISLYWGREINLIAEWGNDVVHIGEDNVDKNSNVSGDAASTAEPGSIEDDSEEY